MMYLFNIFNINIIHQKIKLQEGIVGGKNWIGFGANSPLGLKGTRR